jgi:hypothetical protein
LEDAASSYKGSRSQWRVLVEIRGVHFGLTLLYSYLLPLFSVEETSSGFVFRKIAGADRGLECVFRESTLETKCTAPSGVGVSPTLLGLSKRELFQEVCRRAGLEECIARHVTLIYEPRDKELVLYSVFLSRSTDYYVNTVKWVRELVVRGFVESSSYLTVEFNRVRGSLRGVLERGLDPLSEATELLSISGIGVKSAKAYLLHAYGLTSHAPVDRHYASVLGVKYTQPSKKLCVKLKLDCYNCPRSCVYGYTTRLLGSLNGVVQSLSYIYGRLKSKRRSSLEETLVPDPSKYLDEVERILSRVVPRAEQESST